MTETSQPPDHKAALLDAFAAERDQVYAAMIKSARGGNASMMRELLDRTLGKVSDADPAAALRIKGYIDVSPDDWPVPPGRAAENDTAHSGMLDQLDKELAVQKAAEVNPDTSKPLSVMIHQRAISHQQHVADQAARTQTSENG